MKAYSNEENCRPHPGSLQAANCNVGGNLAPVSAASGPPALEGVLNGSRDRPDSLFDHRRSFANVRDRSTAILKNSEVPLKSLLAVCAWGNLRTVAFVCSFLGRAAFFANAIRHLPLLTTKPLQTLEDLGALLRQVLEGGAKSAEQLRRCFGPGLRFEVRDRSFNFRDRNPPLHHLCRKISDVALRSPALRGKIELGSGPHRCKRKSRRFDLVTRPIRVGLCAALRARLRHGGDQHCAHGDGAKRNIHPRVLLQASIGLRGRQIKLSRSVEPSLRAFNNSRARGRNSRRRTASETAQ